MPNFSDSLPGRILAVFLAVLSASGLAYLVFIFNRGILPPLLQWALICGLGFVAGFSARFLLAGRTLALRLLAALLSILAGLVFLGFVSRAALGARLPHPDQTGLNLDWLGQFLLASLAAWFSLSAWKVNASPQSGKKAPGESGAGKSGSGKKGAGKTRPPKKRPGHTGRAQPESAAKNSGAVQNSGAKGSEAKPASSNSATKAPQKPRLPRSHEPANPQPALSRVARPEFWQSQWLELRSRLRGWWEHGLPQPQQSPSAGRRRNTAIRLQTRRQPPLARGARRTEASQPASDLGVRLIGKEEHRCPYCLEEVLEDDPRGIQICPICHTYHHADCWAVTGACQVPHYHA